MPGLTLIALVGVLALWLAVAVPATGTVSAQTMDDATLSSLTLSVVELDPAFDSATIMYTATVANTVDGNDGNGNAHQPQRHRGHHQVEGAARCTRTA